MSWKVKIDDEYGITNDSRQFMLCKIGRTKNKETGEWEEKWIGYKFGMDDEVEVLERYIKEKKFDANITELSEIKELNQRLIDKFDELRKELGV